MAVHSKKMPRVAGRVQEDK